MDKTLIRTGLLRGGVSLAAFAAAWGLPSAVQAQSCRTNAPVGGVPANTVVTCPGGDVLNFIPEAVSLGSGGVPPNSLITGVLNGTNPTHQQWSYIDANGNLQFIFIAGTYDLRNGIGGTTELRGLAIRNLSGAGLCGVGGQLCTPGGVPTNGTSNFTGQTGGGAAVGTFIAPKVDVTFVNGLVSTFGAAGPEATAATVCGAMPAGTGCGGDLHFGPAITGFAGQDDDAGTSGGDLTIDGSGFRDFVLDTDLLPADVAEDYRSCSESGAANCAVVIDGQGTPFVYSPPVAGSTGPGTNILPVSIVTDGNGTTIVDIAYLLEDFGSGLDLDDLLYQHGSNGEILLSNFNNNATDPTGGAQATFSIPGLADGFLLTQPIGSATDNTYVVSVPVKPQGNYGLYDFGTSSGVGGIYVDEDSLPTVVAVTPGRNASGTSPKTSFVLTFSEPMDAATVEDNFTVRSFNSRHLTIEGKETGKDGTIDENVTRESLYTDVWDSAAFDISWNSDETEATFVFTDGQQLPAGGDQPYALAITLDEADGNGTAMGTPEEAFAVLSASFVGSSSIEYTYYNDRFLLTIRGKTYDLGLVGGGIAEAGDVFKEGPVDESEYEFFQAGDKTFLIIRGKVHDFGDSTFEDSALDLGLGSLADVDHQGEDEKFDDAVLSPPPSNSLPIAFDTRKVFDASKYMDEAVEAGSPGAATAGALAAIFSLNVAPVNGDQASQASDVLTAGLPTRGGDRNDIQ